MAKQRTIVGSPLTPNLLRELGAVDEFSSTPKVIRPDGYWVNEYRIWTCHGYRESGNKNVGFLRINRRSNSTKTFEMNVHQEVLLTDGITHTIEGTIKCRYNPLAVPAEWRISSRFVSADGKLLSELSDEDYIGTTESVDLSTGDWCLFDVVQRLAFARQSSLEFDLLGGMYPSKLNHRLLYRGSYPMRMDDRDIPLHCFVQLGNGILPTEYWLNASHRLLIVTSMNKAYILDDQAEAIFKRSVKRTRQSYRKRMSQRK